MPNNDKLLNEDGSAKELPNKDGDPKAKSGADAATDKITIDKSEISSRDKKLREMSEENKRLKKEQESFEAIQEAKRIANLETADQLKVYKERAEAADKKEKLRSLCEEKGLNANEIMTTALKLDISELDAWTSTLANVRDNMKQRGIEQAKKEMQDGATYNKPSGESKTLTRDEELQAALKAKGLIK